MKANYLEELVAEWYEYMGYFVRRNVPIERRKQGGYESELDVVAFNPVTKHLIHVETSMDAGSWEQREKRFLKKFELGRKHIPSLFKGLEIPAIEQAVVLVFASKTNHDILGGGRIIMIDEFLRDILDKIKDKKMESEAISEQYPILRTLQFVARCRSQIKKVLLP